MDKVQVSWEVHRALSGLAHWLFLQLHLLLPPLLPLLQPQSEVFAVQETDLVFRLCALVLTTHCSLCLEYPAPSSLPGGHLTHLVRFHESHLIQQPAPVLFLLDSLPWHSSTAFSIYFHLKLSITYSVIFHLEWASTSASLILSFIPASTLAKRRASSGPSLLYTPIPGPPGALLVSL